MRKGTGLRIFLGLMLAVAVGAGGPVIAAGPGAVGPGAVGAAPAPLPPVLDLVPADSQMIFLVPNLLALSQKVAMLNDSLGLNMPWMNDILGEIKRATGLTAGVKNDGSLALVAIGAGGRADQGPDMLLIVPVSDYEAFITALKGKASEPVTQVTMTSGHQGFAKNVEGFAVLGARKNLVEGYKPDHASAQLAQKMGKNDIDCMSRSDMSIYLQMPGAEPLVGGEVESFLGVIPSYVQSVLGTGPMGQVVSRAVVGTARDAAAAQTRDTTMAVIGLDVDELGVGITGISQYRADSPMAKTYAGSGIASRLLARVPGQPYLLAGAADLHSLKLPVLLDNLQDELSRQQLGWLANIIKGARPLLDASTGLGVAYYAPPGGLAASPLVGLNVISTDDPKAFVEGFKNYLLQLNSSKIDLTALALAPTDSGAPAPVATFTNQYNPNAQAIEGVSVDQYEVHCDAPLSVVSQLGSGGAMIALGLMSQRGYIVAMDKAVIITTTTDRQMLTQAIAAYRGTGGLDQGLRQIRQRMSPDPTVEGYLNISSLAQSVIGFLAAISNTTGPALQVPMDLPPVGWSLSVQDLTVTKRLFVPMPVMKFTRDVYRAWQAALPPPGAPAGGNPNTPPDANVPRR